MAGSNDDFRALVKAAPAASSTVGHVSAVGGLSRTDDEEHFVLTLASGQAITLPIATVTSHEEIGGSFGQRLVQVTVDPKGLPTGAASALQAASPLRKLPSTDRSDPGEDPIPKNPADTTWAGWDHKNPFLDGLRPQQAYPSFNRKPPISDRSDPGEDPIFTNPGVETTWAGWDHKDPFLDGLRPHAAKDPYADYPGGGSVQPFVLAGSHNVSPQTLAMMQAGQPPQRGYSDPALGYGKLPRQDGSYPTPHGYHLDY